MKKILAILLSFLIIFPYLSTAASELTVIAGDNSINIEENIDNNLIEENINSTLESTEETVILDEEVNTEETVILDEEINTEETIILDEEVNTEDIIILGEEEVNSSNNIIENEEMKNEQNIESLKNHKVYEKEEFNLKAKAINELIESKKNKSLKSRKNANKLVETDSDTNYMAKILKHIDGEIYNEFDIDIILYQDSNLTIELFKINQGYLDEVPILEIADKAVKVQIGAVEGWISNDVVSGNYDVEMVPLNSATNPSYYDVEDGILYHFISLDLESEVEYGVWINVGYAPSYLKSGIKYYSYDGKYFYTDLNKLINDTKDGHHNNSINVNSPYYNYYQYLSFRSTTTYTAQELNNFIDANTQTNSKLRGIGNALISAQNKYGVNALLMLGVAINESGGGLSQIAQEKNNIFGLNAVDSDPYLKADEFRTVQDCISDFVKNWISRAYADPENWTYFGGHLGDKSSGANVKYASDPYWGEKAASFAYKIDRNLGGKDNDLYQLAILKSDNKVQGLDGKSLYTAKKGYPVIITKNNSTNGSYEIFAERTTPIDDGRFEGTYDWSYKGKISSSNSVLINTRKSESELTKGISYQTHVQYYGWQDWKNNGEISGTSGESKRLEGISILLNNTIQGASISYQTHVQDYGWQDLKKDGQFSGTNGQAKRLEAIKINLENAPGYKVEYRVHVQEYGWQAWKSNGEIAGTIGEEKRLEAIEVRIVKDISLEYRTHVQDYGWQNFKKNGEISGTTGEEKRLEAIELKLIDAPQGANIVYQTHVQDYGWQGWKQNGQTAGTSGEAKRLEAIKIKLENAPGYKVEYRVHVQYNGWQEWKSNGEVAGTSGEGKRLEAIEVRIVKS